MKALITLLAVAAVSPAFASQELAAKKNCLACHADPASYGDGMAADNDVSCLAVIQGGEQFNFRGVQEERHEG